MVGGTQGGNPGKTQHGGGILMTGGKDKANGEKLNNQRHVGRKPREILAGGVSATVDKEETRGELGGREETQVEGKAPGGRRETKVMRMKKIRQWSGYKGELLTIAKCHR